MSISKGLCAVLVVIVALAGPLAPLTAMAQTQQPSQYQQSILASEGQSVEPTEGHKTGAAILNVFYVPGKAILCGLGTLGSGALLLLTFGSAYRAAVEFFEEGCHGDWVLTPEHVSGKIAPKSDLD